MPGIFDRVWGLQRKSASRVGVVVCDVAIRKDEEGVLWVSPGSARPPGRAGDLWWYRPLSLDELALVLRFVGRQLPGAPAQVVILSPAQWATSPKAFAAALAGSALGPHSLPIQVVAQQTHPRWYAAVKRELHRVGVAVEDRRTGAMD